MYFLLYDVIKPKWPSSQLMYMDTDSFIININQPYSSIDYNGIESYFDLSGYKSNKTLSHLTRLENKGVLGTLKDEYAGDKIVKFICIRSKCYIVQLASGKRVVKNKGVSDAGNLTISDFESILSGTGNNVYVKQISIKSFNHKVFTVGMIKKALTTEADLKRVRYSNKEREGMDIFETKAPGHHILNN